MDVYDDWKKSLNVIIKNSTKKIPGSVHTNLERIQELEKSLFSSQKISQHFRISTRGKKRAHDDNNKEVSQCGKRSRQNVGFLNPSWHNFNGQDNESSDDESDLNETLFNFFT
ncbi:14906_t:CDS:2 [Funneliformis geosporum]|nr:14906_t:CDS:2 [Funneliformis geosporum]